MEGGEVMSSNAGTTVTIWVSLAEHQILSDVAWSDRISMSDLIRRCIRAELEKNGSSANQDTVMFKARGIRR